MIDIGEKIKELLNKKSLSQTDLANLLNTTRQNVHHLLNKKNESSLH